MTTLLWAEGPAQDAAPITPDDDNDLATPARGFYVGGTGDVVVDTARAAPRSR